MKYIVKFWNSIVRWFKVKFLGYKYYETKPTRIPTYKVADRGKEDKHTKIRRKMEQKSRRINRLWAERKA